MVCGHETILIVKVVTFVVSVGSKYPYIGSKHSLHLFYSQSLLAEKVQQSYQLAKKILQTNIENRITPKNKLLQNSACFRWRILLESYHQEQRFQQQVDICGWYKFLLPFRHFSNILQSRGVASSRSNERVNGPTTVNTAVNTGSDAFGATYSNVVTHRHGCSSSCRAPLVNISVR